MLEYSDNFFFVCVCTKVSDEPFSIYENCLTSNFGQPRDNWRSFCLKIVCHMC